MNHPEPITRLIDELQRLPGIGRKSAQRLAFHLLKQPAAAVHDLADALMRLDRAAELVEFEASPATEPLYTVDPFEPVTRVAFPMILVATATGAGFLVLMVLGVLSSRRVGGGLAFGSMILKKIVSFRS